MPRIHLLDPVVSDQIAAGEVVERPSSVVKELVENALDAGATRVRVELEDAGRKLIRVVDDGLGMDAEDLGLCVKRHATSKIRRADDLLSLGSFGFRGEALPSIASVSQFLISSRQPAASEGARLVVDGGVLGPVQPDGRAPGTTVEVRRLFFNTPARLKFLKADVTESGKVVADLSRLALAHPGVGFALTVDGRSSLDLAPAAGPERLAQLWGRSLAEQALPVDLSEDGLRVHGWCAPPQLSRGNRGAQWLYVNGRPVEHRQLGYHLAQAYGSLMPHGRHAVAALFLELPPEQVDVNVHPAKREVRFRREGLVLDLIRHGVTAALRKADLFTGIELAQSPSPSRPGPSRPWQGEGLSNPGHLRAGSSYGLEEPQGFFVREATGAAPSHVAPSGLMGAPVATAKPDWPVPLAQLHRCYLLCQDKDGLVLVDQHAAHERVLYEKHLKALGRGDIAVQKLLLPQRLSVSAPQGQQLNAWAPRLAELGLDLTDAGGGVFFLASIPAYMKHVQATALLQDLLAAPDADTQPKSGDPAEDFRREAAAMMACKAAIKAGDEISWEAMQQLMADLSACEIPWSCPHGRPPLVKLSLAELERYFQRR
jgi:DNA mismatch repair protein MutL